MANGPLGMFQNPQQNQMQALLGQYYDPRQAAKQQLWGMVRGLGQGLMNQGPSKTPINFGTTLGSAVQGGIEGSDQAVGDYQQKALLGYKMAGEKRDEDWQAKERARKATEWEYQDAIAAGVDDPNMKALAQAFPEIYVKSLMGGGDGGKYGLNPIWTMNPETQQYELYQPNAGGGAPARIQFPGGVLPQPPVSFQDLGTGVGAFSSRGGAPVGAVTPKDIAGAEVQKKIGADKGEAAALYSSLSSKLPGLRTVVGELTVLADQATYTTAGQYRDRTRKELGLPPLPAAVARAKYVAMVDNQVLPMLRDTFGAQFTVKEGDNLRETLGDPNKSPAEKKAVLEAFIEQKVRNLEATAQQGGVDTGTTIPDDPLGLR